MPTPSSLPKTTLRDPLADGSRPSLGARDLATWLAWMLAVVAVGAGAGLLYGPGEWYASLTKPTWNPPSWVFGPAWTTLYALLGTGAWLVWREPGRRDAPERRRAWWAFGVQAVLNLAWTPLFFGLRSPGWAFVDIVLLWVAVLWMTLAFGRVRPLAGTLQVPLVIWVSFALVLNGTIWLIN